MPRKTRAPKLTFNHAMIYASDVTKSLAFYRDALGMRLLQTYEQEGRPVYARLRSPAGNTTLALHQQEPDWKASLGGIRLYFEAAELERFCKRLAASGVKFRQMPGKMPWGWKHAYLEDPDGYEVSLYWAGKQRLKKD